MRRRALRRFALATSLGALSLAASGSPATASVTIGQLAPDGTLSQCNFAPADHAQPAYVVPSLASALVISSWSYNAGSGAEQMMTMKVFRKIGDPATLQVVGHDGARPIAADSLNTFPTNLPVQPGDILGINQPTSANTACVFFAPGDVQLLNPGNLADGESAAFSVFPSDYRLNVSAVVEPDADQDGFGDETQDQCPGQAGPNNGCPPGSQGAAPTTPTTPATCKGKQATIVGTTGNDVRKGTARKDVIAALGGNDKVSGLAGDDLICGGSGKDILKGGKGNDKLLGQAGKDTLRGGPGNDTLKGGAGKDKQVQ